MWHVVSDFDGTVTAVDVAEILLAHFTGDRWLEVERELLGERIGVRESMRREFALVTASREEMLAVLDREARLDAEFPPFLEFARSRGLPVEILSEGLEFYIAHLLRKWGLEVPFRTNRDIWEDGRMRITYPYADATCTLCGTCKMGRVLQLRAAGKQVAYIGDGASDLCPALEATAVFAKGHLARLCEREELPFHPFNDFGDVRRVMAAW